MMQSETRATAGESKIVRVSSHVPGFDAILCGGFLQGGLYVVQGSPGAGKTLLASQILHGHAAAGGHGLFVTVLGESHGRMLLHLETMLFFDRSVIPDKVAYISAYQALDDEGLKGLSTLIRREVLARKTTLLVLDGMSTVESRAESSFEMKRFIYEMQTLASATDCTMFLLTTTEATSAPERTMVDGLIELRQQRQGPRNERRVLVQKIRGTGFLEGEHAFHITRDGLTMFPRIEALFASPTRLDPAPRARLSSGVASLDAMFGGGLAAATMTALVGPSGAGKTTLGLHFLSASNVAEPGLLFGCYESPERLRLKAATMGFDFAAAEQRNEVALHWHPTGEYILDELAHRLLDAVRRRGVRRLVIDGVSGFQRAALEPERIVRFWSALSNELRALGVTTLHTLEMPTLVGVDILPPGSEISALAEAMVLLRYVELRSRLCRLISLSKVREGAFDPTIREFSITDTGVVVGKPFEGVHAAPEQGDEEVAGHARAASSGSGPSSSGGSTGQPR